MLATALDHLRSMCALSSLVKAWTASRYLPPVLPRSQKKSRAKFSGSMPLALNLFSAILKQRMISIESRKRRVLWVGSAGLAKSAAQILGSVRGPSRTAKIGDAKARPKHDPVPVLFCVGSDHPVTVLQVRRLKESGMAGSLDAMTATPDDVREIIRGGRHPLLQISSTREIRDRVRLLIAEAKSVGISAALLTGGNTAELVCDAIGAAAIQLRDEVSPGIPWGVFEGGLLDGLAVATKAGGFGDEGALLHAAEQLGAIEADAR